jgi:hypothetical protein
MEFFAIHSAEEFLHVQSEIVKGLRFYPIHKLMPPYPYSDGRHKTPGSKIYMVYFSCKKNNQEQHE